MHLVIFAGKEKAGTPSLERLSAYDKYAELGKPCSEICVVSLLNNSPAS